MPHAHNSSPGFSAAIETEEAQVWWAGRGDFIGLTSRPVNLLADEVDAGNTPTSTIRGGNLVALEKGSIVDAYIYDPDALINGKQCVAGVLEKHQDMLVNGVSTTRFAPLLTGGLLKVDQLVGADYQALSQLVRRGFRLDDARSRYQGANFLFAPLCNEIHTADYTVTVDDNGKCLIATTNAVNFTLPTLAVGLAGFQVMIYNAVDANMVCTAEANTLLYGDAGGAVSTTLTWSTANKKMGGCAILRCVYTAASTVLWQVINMGTTPVSA